MRTVLFLFLATAAGCVLAQQYRWTDEKGGVHYSDTPPPTSAKSVQKKDLKGSVVSSEVPFELQLAAKNAPLADFDPQELQRKLARNSRVGNQKHIGHTTAAEPAIDEQRSRVVRRTRDRGQQRAGHMNAPVATR